MFYWGSRDGMKTVEYPWPQKPYHGKRKEVEARGGALFPVEGERKKIGGGGGGCCAILDFSIWGSFT